MFEHNKYGCIFTLPGFTNSGHRSGLALVDWPPHHLHHPPRADTWPNAVGMGSDAWGWMDLREQKCGKKT